MAAVNGRLVERASGLTRETRVAATVERAGVLPALILLALVVRVPLWLARHPLHHDEALYGSWARLIASGQDPLLLTAWVDKPPLVLYTLAAAVRLFGASELALRLPGVIACVLTIPLLYGFARSAYDAPTARLAAALLAGCAFAIQFAPTAFTDPWLTLWLITGAWAALTGRAFWAGVAVGLAVASKQQGLLGAPLILALLALHQQRQTGRLRFRPFVTDALLPGLLGFGLVFVPVHVVDSLRWPAAQFLDRSLTTYGGLRLATAADLPQRALAWVQPLGYLFGPPVVTALVLTLAVVPATRALKGRARPGAGARLDLLLTAAITVFLTLHVAVTFQPWDRYLLP